VNLSKEVNLSLSDTHTPSGSKPISNRKTRKIHKQRNKIASKVCN